MLRTASLVIVLLMVGSALLGQLTIKTAPHRQAHILFRQFSSCGSMFQVAHKKRDLNCSLLATLPGTRKEGEGNDFMLLYRPVEMIRENKVKEYMIQ